ATAIPTGRLPARTQRHPHWPTGLHSPQIAAYHLAFCFRQSPKPLANRFSSACRPIEEDRQLRTDDAGYHRDLPPSYVCTLKSTHGQVNAFAIASLRQQREAADDERHRHEASE